MWDYDFQGYYVDPLAMTALDYAAFANAASYQYGVVIGADDVSAMTDQQRIDYLATLDDFLDGIHNGGYQQGNDQNSNYDRPWEDAAPLSISFIETFGWMPHVQEMAGYQWFAYMNRDVDPEFLEAISEADRDIYLSTGSSPSSDLTSLLLSNSVMSGQGGFRYEWVPGYDYFVEPTATNEGGPVIVAGRWDIVANNPGITQGNLYEQGDGGSYLAGLLGITADLATLVDGIYNEVVVHPSIILTTEQAGILAQFKALVWGQRAQLAEIPDGHLIPLDGGGVVTGAELKAAWARVDFQINPAFTYYPRNQSDRGQADWNFGDPIISLNLNMLDGYSSLAGLVYLVLHELGHLTQAARNVTASFRHDGYSPSELVYMEQYANTIGLAIANATNQPYLPNPRHGFLPTVPSFTSPATGGSTGGSTGDPGDGGTGGGGTGGGGAGGDYVP